MNFEYFFAKRITFQGQKKATRLVVKLYILSIALATATMEIALSVVTGFEQEIQNKVVGFSSHILLTHFTEDKHNEIEVEPIQYLPDVADSVRSLSGVVSVAPYIHQLALIKSPEYWDGVVLKGVDSIYNWSYFREILKSGKLPDDYHDTTKRESRQILISSKQAQSLGLEAGDRARLIFPPELRRIRPVVIAGVYETGMEEFDNQVMICDLRMIREIRDWEDEQISGLEITLDKLDISPRWYWDFTRFPFLHKGDVTALLELTDQINSMTPHDVKARPITDIMPEIFDWLNLQHQNVWVILILMMIVAIINMTGVILISIIERTRTVGILKAIGLPNYRVQRMFVLNAFLLIAIGVILGNMLGLGLLTTQDLWGWLKINQKDYFIDTVPVAWVWLQFMGVNLGVIAISTLFMFIPTVIINRISPIKAIRFE